MEFLRKFLPGTLAPLDASAGGAAEGIVLRTEDRSVIAKARFQDYERTFRSRIAEEGPKGKKGRKS